MPARILEPWRSFLREVDRSLNQRAEVHCLGGFVLAILWGLPRPTGDVDFVDVQPSTAADDLMKIAGDGSDLARRYHLCFQRVTIAEYPENYESRLVDVTPKAFHRLRLRAFEVHDLVLAKLPRNSPRDRADVAFLADKAALDRRILRERFDHEMRPYLLNERHEEATLRLWLEEHFGSERS